MRTSEFYDDRQLCLVELWKGRRAPSALSCLCPKCETKKRKEGRVKKIMRYVPAIAAIVVGFEAILFTVCAMYASVPGHHVSTLGAFSYSNGILSSALGIAGLLFGTLWTAAVLWPAPPGAEDVSETEEWELAKARRDDA